MTLQSITRGGNPVIRSDAVHTWYLYDIPVFPPLPLGISNFKSAVAAASPVTTLPGINQRVILCEMLHTSDK